MSEFPLYISSPPPRDPEFAGTAAAPALPSLCYIPPYRGRVPLGL